MGKTKSKSKQMALYQTKKLLQSEGNQQQNEKRNLNGGKYLQMIPQ